MRTLVNIGRYQLTDWMTLVVLPWAVTIFSFTINLIIADVTPRQPHGSYTGGLATIYLYVLILGIFTMTRSMPFGLTLGVSRRTFYLGTTVLIVALAAVYGLGLTLLQVIESATGGWGASVHFFRVPWILAGPWYLTWLTSFVLLAAFALYGAWTGVTYRRWGLPGLTVLIAAQILVAAAVVIALALTHDWSGAGSFFTSLRPPALTGLVAGLAALIGLGGFAAIRRVTL
jgi:hypothetical protein